MFSIFLTLKYQSIMNQRFKEIADELKRLKKVSSDADLARILGISRGEMSNVLSGRRPVSRRIVDNLTTSFPEYSGAWLLTGEGEMMKKSSTATDHSVSIAGEEIRENTIQVNADDTIAMLVAEVAAQRRVTEKVIEQNSMLLDMLGLKVQNSENADDN